MGADPWGFTLRAPGFPALSVRWQEQGCGFISRDAFALCFVLLGAARSLPRERMSWVRLSLRSLWKPQTPGRGDGFGMCVSVCGWVSGSRWTSVMVEGEESKALRPFTGPQPWRLFQDLAA